MSRPAPTLADVTPLDPSIFEALPDALLIARQDRIVWGNRAASRMLRARDLVGRSLESVLAKGERHRLRLLEEQREKGWALPATCRIRFMRLSDGGEVTTDLRFATVGDAFVLSARDVTDLRRAQELMAMLGQLFARGSALPDADALLDKAEPFFEALGWRAEFAEVIGTSASITRRVIAPKSDAIGEHGRQVIGVQIPLEMTPNLADVVKTGRPLFLDNLPAPEAERSIEGPALRERVEGRVIGSAWCPVVTDRKLTHVLAITGRDLTEHDFVAVQLFAGQLGAALHITRLRADLVRHERLAAVGEMAAVMAHEVRNPIGVIFNALSELAKPKAKERARLLLAIVREEAERLRRLVTDLLEFSKPSAIELTIVSAREVVHEAAEAARQDPSCRAGLPNVAIEIEEGITAIETDRVLLRRVLVNLLLNALQHVAPDGRVGVDVRVIAQQLHVRVRNDGPPLSSEVASRLFEPFFTTRATGTGLGLAVVRRIVEGFGGKVTVESNENGTTFAFAVPTRASSGTAVLGISR